MPGPAAGATIEKAGKDSTLVLVRELAHPPEKVWRALTEPEHLREWAPFDADRNIGTVGTAKLTTVGAPVQQVAETQITRADPPKILEFNWGGQQLRWELEPTDRARVSRCGTTSRRTSSRWAPRVGTSASMCSIKRSPVIRSAASSAPMRWAFPVGSD